MFLLKTSSHGTEPICIPFQMRMDSNSAACNIRPRMFGSQIPAPQVSLLPSLLQELLYFISVILFLRSLTKCRNAWLGLVIDEINQL